MNNLREFFEAERSRVFQPDPFFSRRVMARFDERSAETRNSGILDAGFWDIVPSSTRPVLVLAVMLIFCFTLAQMFLPQVPERGMVESFLAPEQTPAESFLYSDTDVPSRPVVMQQLIALEDQQ